jgi:hypothetical protein
MLYFYWVMLNSALNILIKSTQKENKKDKINDRKIIFYIFNILSSQILKKYFYINILKRYTLSIFHLRTRLMANEEIIT